MIFDKLVSLKISLDFYKNSRNPLKRILYYIILKTIMNKIKIIKSSTVSFAILSEFQEFVKIADPNNISNIIANGYNYSNRFAQEIIIKRDISNIIITLRHKQTSIEVEYPVSPRLRVNKNYKTNIEDNSKEPIKDKYTAIINNAIRNYIYDFVYSYMKGEYDNATN